MPRARDHHFDSFPQHSQFKHEILRRYLETWVPRVALGRGVRGGLVLIDAFAGEGKDAVGNSGSPVHMGRVAVRNIERLKELTGRKIGLQVVAIEEDAERCGRLEAHMSPFGSSVRVLNGTLEDYLDDLLKEFVGNPMLCFFDPFGISGLDSETLRKGILEPGREILMLVDSDGAHRLIRAATAKESRRSRKLRETSVNLSLFESPEQQTVRITAERDRSNAHLHKTGTAAASHLTRAIGSDSWRAIAALPRDSQRDAVVDLFERQLAEWGARFTTRIPVRNAAGQPAYVLLHASQHQSGRSAMKEAVHGALNSGILPVEVCERLRAEMTAPEDLLARIHSRFGGSVVPWTEKAAPCLKRFLLEDTDAFPWQFYDVKARLHASGWRLAGKKLLYSIPQPPDLQRAG